MHNLSFNNKINKLINNINNQLDIVDANLKQKQFMIIQETVNAIISVTHYSLKVKIIAIISFTTL